MVKELSGSLPMDDEMLISLFRRLKANEEPTQKAIKNSRFRGQRLQNMKGHLNKNPCDNCLRLRRACTGGNPCKDCKCAGITCCHNGIGASSSFNKNDIHPMPNKLNALSSVVQQIGYECKMCKTNVSNVWFSKGVDDWYCYRCAFDIVRKRIWMSLPDDKRCHRCGLAKRVKGGPFCERCMSDTKYGTVNAMVFDTFNDDIAKDKVIVHCAGCTQPIYGIDALTGDLVASLDHKCLSKFGFARKQRMVATSFHCPLFQDTYEEKRIIGRSKKEVSIYISLGYPKTDWEWKYATLEKRNQLLNTIDDFHNFKWELAKHTNFFNIFPVMRQNMIYWLVPCLKEFASYTIIDDLVGVCCFYFLKEIVHQKKTMEHLFQTQMESLQELCEDYPSQTIEEDVLQVFVRTISLLIDYGANEWNTHLNDTLHFACTLKDKIITLRAAVNVKDRYLDQLFCLSFDTLNKFLLFERLDSDHNYSIVGDLHGKGWTLYSDVHDADVIYGLDDATYNALIEYWKAIEQCGRFRTYNGFTGKNFKKFFHEDDDFHIKYAKKKLKAIVDMFKNFIPTTSRWYNVYSMDGYHEAVRLIFQEAIGVESSDSDMMDIYDRLKGRTGYEMKWLINALLIVCEERHYKDSYLHFYAYKKDLKY